MKRIVTSVFAAITLLSAAGGALASGQGAGDPDAAFGFTAANRSIAAPGSKLANGNDGALYVLHENTVRRFTVAGVLDTTYGVAGVATFPRGLSNDFLTRNLAVGSDGRVIVVGNTSTDAMLTRLSPAGFFDSSFGVAGFRAIDFSSEIDFANSVLIDPLGRIVICVAAQISGDFDFGVARLTAQGDLDTTFAGDGKTAVPFGYNENCEFMLRQPDGMLVFAGTVRAASDSSFFGITRLTDAGALDVAFGSNGKQLIGFSAVALEVARALLLSPTNQIYVLGDNGVNPAVARLTSAGQLDPSFDGDGKQLLTQATATRLRGAVMQPDGSILLAGGIGTNLTGRSVVDRLSPAGTIDASAALATDVFLAETEDAVDIVQFADARFVVLTAKAQDANMSVLRYYWNSGAPLQGLQTTGFYSKRSGSRGFEAASDMLIEPSGAIVSVGTHSTNATVDIAVTRHTPNGQLDQTFGGSVAQSGTVQYGDETTVELGYALARQTDGNLVVAGSRGEAGADFYLARFLSSSGQSDGFFGTPGSGVILDMGGTDTASDVAIAPDGKVVVAGYSLSAGAYRLALARLMPDGALDPTFGTAGKVIQGVVNVSILPEALLIEPDGRIVVASYYSFGDNAVLQRFKIDGTLDTTFGSAGQMTLDLGFNEHPYAVSRDAVGRYLLAGSTSSGTGRLFVARINADGMPDSTFGNGGSVFYPLGANGIALDLDLRADGQIAVAGCTSILGIQSPVLWQLQSSGAGEPAIGNNGFATRLPGGEGCLTAVRFSGVDRVVVAGSNTVAGNSNMLLMKFETTTMTQTQQSGKTYMPLLSRAGL